MTENHGKPIDRRTFNSIAAGGALATVIGLAPGKSPVEPDVTEQVVDGVVRLRLRAPSGSPIVLRRKVETSTFVLAGLTWARGAAAPSSVVVRTRTGGLWSPWQTVTVDADDDDKTAARPGTTPVVAPGADTVEVQVHPAAGGALPADLRLELVGDEAQPLDAEAADVEAADVEADEVGAAADADAAESGVTALAVSRPTIRSRRLWGADESLRQNYGEPIQYGRVIGAFVHHTAGTNSYASWQVPSIIRSIYRYHVVSRDFYDIGYNMLVDRFGRLWEGAYGGLDKAVVAAHTKYYNSSSFGISAIGTYTSKRVEPELMRGLAAAISWKFRVHGVPRGDDTAWYSGTNASPKRRISGHRDAKSTACPGSALYAKLPALRTEVTRRITTDSALRLSGPWLVKLGERATLSVRWAASGSGSPLTGTVVLQRLSGGSWEYVRQVTVTDGRGSTVITPGGRNTYRLRAASCTRSDIDLSHPRGTSNTYTIDVHDGDYPFLRLGGPARVTAGSQTHLDVVWLTESGRRVTGSVNLQRRRGTRWEHVRRLSVTNGRATTVIAPGASNTYRLRASSASSPSGVPLAGRDGTSNAVSISVS